MRTIKEKICGKFSTLVESGQLIVREDLFLNARNLTPESLNTIRTVILEVGEAYPTYGEPIPKSWMSLQNEMYTLKQEGKRIISFQFLVDLNSKMNVPLNEDELLLFTLFLHHTGYSLHFQKASLKDLIMLDPKLIIDAMRCFVTVAQFALKFWKTNEWEMMRNSGRVEESYINKLWLKKSEPTFYVHREYLLQVMRELDLLCLPKVYDKDGYEIQQTAFFVPCMVKESHPSHLSTLRRISSGEALQIRFEFADILPPAVYNRLVCTSLSLWQVHEGQLYDGCTALQSGSQHVLVIQRESQAIIVSFLHNKGPSNVDIDLCRAVRLYFHQTIQRILSTYQMASDDVIDDLLTITCKPQTFARQFDDGVEKVIQILLLPGTWSHLWFAGVRECPPWCSIVGATVTVHQFFCILLIYHFNMNSKFDSIRFYPFMYQIVMSQRRKLFL